MGKKKEPTSSHWLDIEDYEDGVDDSHKGVDLTSYERNDDENIVFVKDIVSELQRLPNDTEVIIKLAANSIDEYSEAYVDVGEDSCRVVSKCAINGSSVIGHVSAQEIAKALKESNYQPENLTYTQFEHYEDENGAIENGFYELSGGYGEYGLVGIDDAEKLTEEQLAIASDSENYLVDRSTLGIAFYEPSDVHIFIESDVLKRAKLL